MVKTRSTIKKERDIGRLYKSGFHGDGDHDAGNMLTVPKKLDFDKAKTPRKESKVTTTKIKTRSARKASMTPRQKQLQSPKKLDVHKAVTPRSGSKVKITSTRKHSARKTPMLPRQQKLPSTPPSTRRGKTPATPAVAKSLTPRFAVNKRYGIPSPPVFSPGKKMISFDTPRKTHIDELHCVFNPGLSPLSPNRRGRNSGCRDLNKTLSSATPKKSIFVSPKSRPFASPLEHGSVGTFSAYSRGTRMGCSFPTRGDSPLMMYVSFVTGYEDGHSTPSKPQQPKFEATDEKNTIYSSPVPTKTRSIGYWTPYPAIEDRPAPDMMQSHTTTALFHEDLDMAEFDAEFEDFALLDF